MRPAIAAATLLAIVLATAAPLAGATTHYGTKTVEIGTGKSHEHILHAVPKGTKVFYTVNVDAPLNARVVFDVHTHAGDEFQYLVRPANLSREASAFTTNASRDVYLEFQNPMAQAIRVTYSWDARADSERPPTPTPTPGPGALVAVAALALVALAFARRTRF